MPRKNRAMEPKVVTFKPHRDGRYGDVVCSWEDEPRDTPITREAAEKFAEGWKAEFVVKELPKW
jgi:hypothetical protein